MQVYLQLITNIGRYYSTFRIFPLLTATKFISTRHCEQTRTPVILKNGLAWKGVEACPVISCTEPYEWQNEKEIATAELNVNIHHGSWYWEVEIRTLGTIFAIGFASMDGDPLHYRLAKSPDPAKIGVFLDSLGYSLVEGVPLLPDRERIQISRKEASKRVTECLQQGQVRISIYLSIYLSISSSFCYISTLIIYSIVSVPL